MAERGEASPLAKVEWFFHRCLELRAEEREAFLRRECPDEETLRAVLDLLRADERGADFLEPPR